MWAGDTEPNLQGVVFFSFASFQEGDLQAGFIFIVWLLLLARYSRPLTHCRNFSCSSNRRGDGAAGSNGRTQYSPIISCFCWRNVWRFWTRGLSHTTHCQLLTSLCYLFSILLLHFLGNSLRDNLRDRIVCFLCPHFEVFILLYSALISLNCWCVDISFLNL